MEFQENFGKVIVDYSKYVESQKKKGEDAVSFFKYAFGNL